jgi:hypothetical protein
MDAPATNEVPGNMDANLKQVYAGRFKNLRKKFKKKN